MNEVKISGKVEAIEFAGIESTRAASVTIGISFNDPKAKVTVLTVTAIDALRNFQVGDGILAHGKIIVMKTIQILCDRFEPYAIVGAQNHGRLKAKAKGTFVG